MLNLTTETVDSYIDKMLDILYDRDDFLLNESIDMGERAITHRMGMHLQQIVTDKYDVDCEYNRMGKIVNGSLEYTEGDYFAKTICLSGELVSDEDDNGSKVFPDIIVHKRGTANNYIIIEVKVVWKNSKAEHDLVKLKAYKKDLKYSYAYFIQLAEQRGDVVIKKV